MKKIKIGLAIVTMMLFFGIFNLPHNYRLALPIVQGSTTPSDGDAWTENDNSTVVWIHSPTYPDTIEFQSLDAQVGTYALKVTHDSATTYMAFSCDLQAETDFTAYDYFSMYLKFVSPTSEGLYLMFTKTGAFTGNKKLINAISMANNTWRKWIIPFNAFRWSTGNIAWDEVRYLCFQSSPVGSADGSQFFIDGLHFGSWSTPTVSNAINEVAIPNLYSFYPQFAERIQTKGGTDYTSLWEFAYTITGNGVNSDIESEVLGHVILALAIAYNQTEDKTLLDKAEVYFNFLNQLENSTVGGYHDDWETSALRDEMGATHNGWILAGLSYLYDVTGNTTYKTSAENTRNFIISKLWDSGNNWFDAQYIPSDGTIIDSTTWHAMRNGACLAGLGAYYRYVTENSTVASIIDSSINSLFTYNANVNATYSENADFESTTYQHWGYYEAYKALNNETYKTLALYHFDMNNAQHELAGNGSVHINHLKYHMDGQGFEGWGLACSQLLKMLLYLNVESTTRYLRLYEKSMFDYFETVRTEGSAFNNYAFNRYRNSTSNPTMNTMTYVPMQAFMYAGLILYKYNVDGTENPFILSSDKYITTSSRTPNSLLFTVSASSGQTSTTKVCSKGKGQPTVKNADNWTWDPSGFVTVQVTHSSTRNVEIIFSASAGGQEPQDQEGWFLNVRWDFNFLFIVLLIVGIILFLRRGR